MINHLLATFVLVLLVLRDWFWIVVMLDVFYAGILVNNLIVLGKDNKE
jgi:hypothetical protein